jgi:hypothetical protein
MSFRTASRYVPTLAILAATAMAAPLQASPDTDPMAESATIRVVNNHQSRVAVYIVQDAKRYYVGTVNRTRVQEFELPEEFTGGSFQVQIFPRSNPAGLGAWSGTDKGIQTRPVEIAGGQAINLFVEPTLNQSSAQVATG